MHLGKIPLIFDLVFWDVLYIINIIMSSFLTRGTTATSAMTLIYPKRKSYASSTSLAFVPELTTALTCMISLTTDFTKIPKLVKGDFYSIRVGLFLHRF